MILVYVSLSVHSWYFSSCGLLRELQSRSGIEISHKIFLSSHPTIPNRKKCAKSARKRLALNKRAGAENFAAAFKLMVTLNK